MESLSEKWRDVIGNPFYQVSDQGRVRSVDRVIADTLGRRQRWRGRILSLLREGRGYLKVVVCVGKKGHKRQRKVHQLVAESWLGPCPCGLEINHIDGNKKNNASNNLEYVTRSKNVQHAYRTGLRDVADNANLGEKNGGARLTQTQVIDAYKRHKTGESLTSIAKDFGVTITTVGNIVNGRTWKHLNLLHVG